LTMLDPHSGRRRAGPESGGSCDETRQREDLAALSAEIAAAEREGGYPEALRVFESRASRFPSSVLWKLHLELAECAKRGASLTHVKEHLGHALTAKPHVVQVWLDACRTCDELGEPEECRAVLELGLSCCPQSEQLALKLVRVLERLGDHAALRALMGSFRAEALEKTYKVLLEAAHFEVRAGNGAASLAFLRSLMLRMPHQGSVYCEVCRAESVLGKQHAALRVAEHGVKQCQKYGPLWFVLTRQAEKLYGARAVNEYAAFARQHVCHELHWKFHIEVAAAFSLDAQTQASRRSVTAAALCCPGHLRWKVWLLAARAELWNDSVDVSCKLLARARQEAPPRVQAAICIEFARTKEFSESLEEARVLLAEARTCEGHDWKVFLEHIFMEARQGCLDRAREVVLQALELHPAAGRLWSTFIALEHRDDTVMDTFRRAVREVPKSGEVWCEGARIFLNPLCAHFNLQRAHRCLAFAIHFTPQYGDSFLESLRLRCLLAIQHRFRSDPLAIGFLSGNSPNCRIHVASLVAKRVHDAVMLELKSGSFNFDESHVNGDTPHLDVPCTYADPNYGFLWFWCRESARSRPCAVLQRMREEVVCDLTETTLWTYVWALACCLFDIRHSATDAALAMQDFATGSLKVSRCFANGTGSLSRSERRRLIFGSDILSV